MNRLHTGRSDSVSLNWMVVVVMTSVLLMTASAATTSASENMGVFPSVKIVSPCDNCNLSASAVAVDVIANGFKLGIDGEVCVELWWHIRGAATEQCGPEPRRIFDQALEGEIKVTARLVDFQMIDVGQPHMITIQRKMVPRINWLFPGDGEMIVGRQIHVGFHVDFFTLDADHQLCVEIPAVHSRVCSPRPVFTVPGIVKGKVDLLATVVDGPYDIQGVTKVARTVTILGGNEAQCGAGTGLVCLHGKCAQQEDGVSVCVCDANYYGKYCQGSLKSQEIAGPRTSTSLVDMYLSLVRNAILSPLRPHSAHQAWQQRNTDRNWESPYPDTQLSMVGSSELFELEKIARDVIEDEIPGDFMETGVWQGGASILLQGVLKAYGQVENRRVWLCDSFDGVPPPDARFSIDDGDTLYKQQGLKITLDRVVLNFEALGLLDDNVEMVIGFFNETMNQPRVQAIDRLAILRLDGDLYQSTVEVLDAMYDRVVVGGYVVVDDWALQRSQAKRGVLDFRAKCGIGAEQPIIEIGPNVYWRKTTMSRCA